MNATTYQPAFSVKVVHEYFEHSYSSKIKLLPNADTQDLMQRYNLLIREVEGEFSFYIKGNEGVETFLDYLENTLDVNQFTFQLMMEDPLFYGYTNVSMDTLDGYYYETGVARNTFQGDDVVLQPIISTREIDMVFGTIQIDFKSLRSASDHPQKFLIQFEARKTIWNYYVVITSSLEATNLIIEDSNSFQFEGPTSTTLQNGQKALLYSSGKMTLAMSEVPKQQFNLLKRSNSSGNSETSRVRSQMIIEGLPIPNPSQLELIEQDGETMVMSPMYIYV